MELLRQERTTEQKSEEIKETLIQKRKEFSRKLEQTQRHLKTLLSSKGEPGGNGPDSPLIKGLSQRTEMLKECLRNFDEAIINVDKGKYGICENCGRPISLERLKILPFTLYCTTCQKEIENNRLTIN